MTNDVLRNQLIILATGVVLRVIFFSLCSSNYIDFLTQRIEYLSCLTSYSRMVEGKYLVTTGKELYSTDFFRLNPVIAAIVFPMIGNTVLTFSFVTVIDVVTTYLLMRAVGKYYKIAGPIYLLNPYTVVSPSALSLQSLHMLAVVLILYSTYVKQSVNAASFAVAITLILKPVIPVVLVFPIAVCLGVSSIRVLFTTMLFYGALHLLSYWVNGFSWSYFHPSVLAPLLISGDVEPNLSLAWALFTVALKDSLWYFRLAYHGHVLFSSALIHIRSTQVAYSQESKERFLTLMTCSVLLFHQNATAIDHCLIVAIFVACDEKKYLDVISTFFMHVLIGGLVFSSATGPLWLEHNTGNMNFLFHLVMVVFFGGVIAITQSLKLTRLDGYQEKEKEL